MEAQVKKEAQRDANLREARIATAARVGKVVISLSVAGAKLAATAGADVTSYISIVKDLKSAYEELRQQLKDGSELAGDVFKDLVKVRDAAHVADTKKRLGATEEGRQGDERQGPDHQAAEKIRRSGCHARSDGEARWELGGKIDDRTTIEKLLALDSQVVKGERSAR